MRREELHDLMDEVLSEARKVLEKKNVSYSTPTDSLYNFSEAARLTDSSPLKVWSFPFIKHVLSIMAYVRRGDESEPIESQHLLAGKIELPVSRQKKSRLHKVPADRTNLCKTFPGPLVVSNQIAHQ